MMAFLSRVQIARPHVFKDWVGSDIGNHDGTCTVFRCRLRRSSSSLGRCRAWENSTRPACSTSSGGLTTLANP